MYFPVPELRLVNNFGNPVQKREKPEEYGRSHIGCHLRLSSSDCIRETIQGYFIAQTTAAVLFSTRKNAGMRGTGHFHLRAAYPSAEGNHQQAHYRMRGYNWVTA